MSAIEYDPVTKPNEPITGVTVNAAQVYSEWQSNLCGCFGHCTVLCQTCLCYHCTLSNVYTKLETGVPSCSCGTCCANCCADGITAGQASFCGIVGTRRAIISRYNIAGESMCRTLCCAALCTCCSFCQTQREMIIRSDGCGGCCAQGDLVQNERAPDAAPPMGGDSTHDIRYIAPLRPAQRWQSGICGCASCMDCLDCYLCLPCMLGYVGAKVDNLHNIGEPNQEPKMDCCSCLGACLCAYAFIYMNRRELIQRYNIQGESHCDTCCQVYWCTACSAGQQRREMAYRGEWTGGCCLKEAPVLAAVNGRVPLATQSPQKQ